MKQQGKAKNADDTQPPTLGLDLDGTLDESPAFFRVLSHCWTGKVIVITYRSDRAKAEADIAALGVRYDELILVDRFDAKAAVIAEKRVSVYVDDQDEMLMNIPSTVTVLKIRNGGNFDFDSMRWLYSKRTGRSL